VQSEIRTILFVRNEKRNLSYIAITAVAAAIIKLGLVEETFQKNKDKYFFLVRCSLYFCLCDLMCVSGCE
jgi:hypothetical protein